MGQIGQLIANTASMGPRYVQRLTTGIPSDRFACFSAPGGETIVANHPAFIIGHLCLYPQKVLELLGVDAGPATPPQAYEELFSKDATCQDDAEGKLYPSDKELLQVFESTHTAALAALAEASDEQLLAPNPVDSPMKQVLPTLGSVLAFYMTGHLMTHLGQLSTWRRMEKLSPA